MATNYQTRLLLLDQTTGDPLYITLAVVDGALVITEEASAAVLLDTNVVLTSEDP